MEGLTEDGHPMITKPHLESIKGELKIQNYSIRFSNVI